MAAVTGIPATIDPSRVPADRTRGYGLQSQAFVVEETVDSETLRPDERLSIRGVTHEVNNCGRLSCWDHGCTHTGDKFDNQHGQDWVTATSFSIIATGPKCFGKHAIQNAERRARERMEALEWAAVEYAVMTGACGASPYLVGPPTDGDGLSLWIRPGSADGYTALANWSTADLSFAPVTPAGTDPVNPAVALAVIEWGMRDYGGPGVIHAPSWTYPWFRDWEIREASRLVTQLGTGWAFGRGYVSTAPGTDPTAMPTLDTPPDWTAPSAWLYGTGAVRIWRGPITVTPPYAQYNFRRNQSMVLAERSYTVSIQCPYVAVNVDLTEIP